MWSNKSTVDESIDDGSDFFIMVKNGLRLMVDDSMMVNWSQLMILAMYKVYANGLSWFPCENLPEGPWDDVG